MSENIKVVIRFRPLNKKEDGKDPESFRLEVDTKNGVINISEKEKETHQFIFDTVFDGISTQETVFNTVAKNAIEWVSQGYNATIFAYGCTGCLDPETLILLFDGTVKKAKDIKIGDIIMGDDSTPRNVLKLFEGEDDMYDIIPVKGESYRVNKSHILTLFNNKIIDISVSDYIILANHEKQNYKGIRIKNSEMEKIDINVVYIGKGKYNGFMLDGNHRFLLSDFTVTHNSGKSHCLFGQEKDPGIIPRTCKVLFDSIQKNEDMVEVKIKCSFLEIYREHIRDLLSNSKEYDPEIRIRQNRINGVYIQGLIEKFVRTPEEILASIKEGMTQRTTASTSLNSESSRSHAVVTLTVNQVLKDGSEIISKLNLIDLAGSENVGRSEAQGTTLIEAQTINRSLSCLGNVIFALTEKGREHIPYRDSKLTYLLQDSLGGNSKTILIATASPSGLCYSETVNTLKFAQRTKLIKNIPKVNKNDSNINLTKTIELLNKKIEELEAKCNDNQVIIQAIECAHDQGIPEQVALLKSKNERLEKKIKNIEEEKRNDEDRYCILKDIFEKQRNLAKNTAKDLWKEKIKSFVVINELEQYKNLLNTFKNNTSKPEVLAMLVEKASIAKGSVPIVEENGFIDIELESPREF